MNNYTKEFIHFDNPLELLTFYDPDILAGKTKISPKQITILKEFAKELNPGDILRQSVVAANGSGKSKYIIAPCICWLATSFDWSLSVCTTASAFQLDTQTERYVNMLIDKMNLVHHDQFKMDIWDKVKRKKKFLPTNGHVDLYATDEPNKAEGKHPLVDGAEFAIFVDEGKSITEDIYGAMMRCKGYSRRQDVSSPGDQHGHFYEVCSRAELGWSQHKITAFDCPWIREEEIRNDILKYGIHDPLVRSSIFAEFTSIDSKTVIDRDTLTACCRMEVPHNNFVTHSGLDLSAGGDETCLSIFDGNRQRAQETARYKNTMEGAKEIIHWIQKHKLVASQIWADDGGIGRGIIDRLLELGYPVKRVLNNHRAFDTTRYDNFGSESWFSLKRYVEEGQIILLDDSILKGQLCNRYYRLSDKNKILLESKEKAKANGHPSPDRADAAVLAWTNYRWPLNITAEVKKEEETKITFGSEEELVRYFQSRARVNLNPIDLNKSTISRPNINISQNNIVAKMLGRNRLDSILALRKQYKHLN